MILNRNLTRLTIALITALIMIALWVPTTQAQSLSSDYFLESLRKKNKGKGKGKRRGPKKRQPIDEPTNPVDPAVPTFQSWMHEDVQAAWDAGFTGQNTNIISTLAIVFVVIWAMAAPARPTAAGPRHRPG